MPVDQRRINGPEVTIPYNIYFDSNAKQTETRKTLPKKRTDGRDSTELRKIFVKTGIVSQAKGSAYIEMGKTKVVCSVFDPREIPNKTGYSLQGELFCEFKFSPFSCLKRKIHQQDSEEKEYSIILQRALESAVCRHEFPNFQVDVYALVLDNGGSSLAAAIMASSLALSDASVPMFGLVTAVTAGIYQDRFYLDLTEEEEVICSKAPDESTSSRNYGIVIQANLPQHGQISEFFHVGSMDLANMKPTVEAITTACKELCPVMQQCLVKSVLKALKRKENMEKEDQ
ncbi:exosome complex component MTR3 [Cephus cinctus]|uniref:Exosome complex component MTR3 n=1 Tax=Cephus cinctus TaxID=211228 RepID=A0AAJ7FHI4_CEPCN|nr:exosome complex component MTR3 [Cephus cinctus]